MVGGGEVESRAARLDGQHQGAGAGSLLEVGDQLVPDAPAQAAVIAADLVPGPLAQVLGQDLAPAGEVGEDQDPLAGREHVGDDLLQPGQLAGPAGQDLLVVVVAEVGGRMVTDLLQAP